ELRKIFAAIALIETSFDQLSLLNEVESFKRVNVFQFRLNVIQLLAQGIDTWTTSSTGAIALKSLEITTNSKALCASRSQRRFVRCSHRGTLLWSSHYNNYGAKCLLVQKTMSASKYRR